MDNRPIGVFDSGLGGLTVVKALSAAMPNEQIVYFGDTGRVPYGNRSRATIEQYARQDEAFLLSQNVKLIIAACGTVSSVAAHTGDHLPVPFFGVVQPAAAAAAKATKNGKIGVIGTAATIASGAYERELLHIDPTYSVISTDCPLFVPLVEEGWISPDDPITRLTAQRYLQPVRNAGVDTLILGCTHYPLIAPILQQVMGEHVTLINAGQAAADACQVILQQKQLNTGQTQPGTHQYFVTDRPDSFLKIASLFLQGALNGTVQRVQVEQL